MAGSDFVPYEIIVTLLDDGRIGERACTCPYDWGGYCKHIVAVLLTALTTSVAGLVRAAQHAAADSRGCAGFFPGLSSVVIRVNPRPTPTEGRYMEKTPDHLKHAALTERIIKIFYQVYNELGFGLLEAAYANAMAIALIEAGMRVVQQASIPVYFRGRQVGDYRCDLLVDDGNGAADSRG